MRKPDPGEFQEERIERAMSALDASPETNLSVMVADGIAEGVVVVTFAIRGKGAGELHIPNANYDPFKFMELLEKHTGGVVK